MIRLFPFAALVIIGAAMLARSQPDVEGCAAVGRGPGDYIRIAEESAVIVWDPVKKIEHFIRRAAFDTKSPDFGFLVPTPNVPTLKDDVEDDIFRQMNKWIAPKIVTQSHLTFTPILCCFAGASKAPAIRDMNEPKDSVRVLGEQKVGGFDTAILEADSTEDLANWLKKNGYSNDPELQSWLFPYVANKWKITAFKISQDPKTGGLATTKPVRMSFATDKPFFPYREPEEKKKPDKGEKGDNGHRNGPRLLRVFFVSDARMDGKLGTDAKWNASVPWADQLTDAQRRQLSSETGVPEDEIPAKTWMTTFEDRASPRPGKEEVYFEPSQDRTPIRPPDVIVHVDGMWIPIDCAAISFIFALLLAWTVVKLARKKRAA
ncbi:MAG: DUF2330 domain-containing protein [Gemmataceae bacterium]|nr:DUF2330 domain-containing protein [Gemmataceae bacterium]